MSVSAKYSASIPKGADHSETLDIDVPAGYHVDGATGYTTGITGLIPRLIEPISARQLRFVVYNAGANAVPTGAEFRIRALLLAD